ncbi:hypothetical protein ACVWXO_001931 [Bradyrhizobium sp. LM2.7]
MAPAPGGNGSWSWGRRVALGEGHWENLAIGNAFRACRLAAPGLSAILVRFAVGAAVTTTITPAVVAMMH